MNGKTWYPWQEGFNGNSSGEFVPAFKHVVDIFRREGANNVVFVWGPNVSFYGSTPLTSLYPGDDYVGWVSVNGYNRATQSSEWKTFSQVYNNTLAEINALAPSKPLLIGEIGCTETGGSKADWITDAFSVRIPATALKGVIWFNVQGSRDYRIQSSPQAQSAFAAAVADPVYLGANSWIPVSTYEISYRAAGSSSWNNAGTNLLYKNLTGLSPGTTYEYRVRGIKTDGSFTAWSPLKTFTTQVTTSLAPVEEDFDVKFFPVPFSGEAILKINSSSDEEIEFLIIDIKGSLVEKSESGLMTNTEIPVGGRLAAGSYFLKVKAGKKERMIRIVKN